jgi:hypothetical protein
METPLAGDKGPMLGHPLVMADEEGAQVSAKKTQVVRHVPCRLVFSKVLLRWFACEAAFNKCFGERGFCNI